MGLSDQQIERVFFRIHIESLSGLVAKPGERRDECNTLQGGRPLTAVFRSAPPTMAPLAERVSGIFSRMKVSECKRDYVSQKKGRPPFSPRRDGPVESQTLLCTSSSQSEMPQTTRTDSKGETGVVSINRALRHHRGCGCPLRILSF
jgi:hypothetical protein